MEYNNNTGMNTAICFIAIVPGPELCSEVRAFQQTVSEKFQSSRALRAPPHITLIPPFKWGLELMSQMDNELRTFTEARDPLLIQLKNFEAFPPRVVYLNVTDNPALNDFQAALQNHLSSKLGVTSDRPERVFRPHMTVGFRDLRKKMFHNAWTHFSEIRFEREFLASQICLLQHSGERWNERTYFKMTSGGTIDYPI
ncbi:MAG: 2'-5' RNA ligase family protein [bacterium]